MAHSKHLWISEMYYTLLDGLPELLNADCPPPSFKLEQVDGEFLHQLHLSFQSDTIHLPLKLIHNAIRIRNTPGGGFDPSF